MIYLGHTFANLEIQRNEFRFLLFNLLFLSLISILTAEDESGNGSNHLLS